MLQTTRALPNPKSRTVRPGQHLVLIGGIQDALAARSRGFQLKDTIHILLPAGCVLEAFLFRQPLEGTIVENVLSHNQGGLWIDGCRIRTSENLGGAGEFKQPAGRWPPNLLLVHGPNCKQMGEKSAVGHASQNGTETVLSCNCQPNCPVRALDEMSGTQCNGGPVYQGKGPGGFSGNIGGLPTCFAKDSGVASRFYPQFNCLQNALHWLIRLTEMP